MFVILSNALVHFDEIVRQSDWHRLVHFDGNIGQSDQQSQTVHFDRTNIPQFTLTESLVNLTTACMFTSTELLINMTNIPEFTFTKLLVNVTNVCRFIVTELLANTEFTFTGSLVNFTNGCSSFWRQFWSIWLTPIQRVFNERNPKMKVKLWTGLSCDKCNFGLRVWEQHDGRIHQKY